MAKTLFSQTPMVWRGIQGNLHFSTRRPDRRLFNWLERNYATVVALLLSAIVLMALLPYGLLWVVLVLVLYWLYRGAKATWEDKALLGREFDSDAVQFGRMLLLIGGATAFLCLVYTNTLTFFPATERDQDVTTLAHMNQPGVDTLWLLYVIAIYVVAQYTDFWKVAGAFCLSVLGLGLAYFSAFQWAVLSWPVFQLYATKVLWIALLSFVLHALVRSLSYRAANLTLLHDIQRDLLNLQREGNTNKILQMVTDRIHSDFDYPYVTVFERLPDNSTRCVAESASSTRSLIQENFRMEPFEGIIGHVLKTGEHYRADDVLHSSEDPTVPDPHYKNSPSYTEVRSELAVPLTTFGQTVAILDVEDSDPNAFPDPDEEFMLVLAKNLGSILENVVQANTQQQIANLTHKLAGTYLSREGLKETLQQVADAACSELDVDLAILFDRDPRTGEFEFGAKSGIVLDETHIEASIERQCRLNQLFLTTVQDFHFHENIHNIDDPLFQFAADVTQRGYPPFPVRERITSRATMRLVAEGTCVGIMFLNYRRPYKFKSQHARFETFAYLTALAIQKAHVQEHAVTGERHELAWLLHHALLQDLLTVSNYIFSFTEDPSLDSNSRQTLGRVQEHLQYCIDVVKFLHRTRRHHPPGGIYAELANLESWANKVFKPMRFTLKKHGTEPTISPKGVEFLYRSTRELIINSYKYSEGKHVVVECSTNDGIFMLRYEDDGIGIRLDDHEEGSGLDLIQKEAKTLGGVFEIDGLKSDGFSGSIRIPLVRERVSD